MSISSELIGTCLITLMGVITLLGFVAPESAMQLFHGLTPW